jgi:1-acyl-sn-glycerol-3-phosphate acyltransferase
MPDNPIARRAITVPAVFALLIAVTIASPALFGLAAVVDMARVIATRRRGVLLRSLGFLWIYLVGEAWALLALLGTTVLMGRTKLAATYALQDRWASWNLTALRLLFSLEIRASGEDSATPGPMIVISRHASLVDTLLPARFIARANDIRLRYVLKKELLFDPALDIAGSRLPNVFVDRTSREATERQAIKKLAEDLGPDDGVLIYPEGTRFDEAKLKRHQKRQLGAEPGSIEEVASQYRRVLPPRPGGTLSLLEASDADVVVFAHRGLEGLATLRDIWRGDLVGSKIDIAIWRVPRSEIPQGRTERVEWLFHLWAKVDDWVCFEQGDTT